MDDYDVKKNHINILSNFSKQNDDDKFITYLQSFSQDNIDLNMRDSNGNLLIFSIIVANKVNLLRIMLTFDIRLDVFDTDGYGVLYYPIKHNYSEIMDSLLDYDRQNIGISLVNFRDNNHNTPIFYAIRYANHYILEQLIINGANVDQMSRKNIYPLHIAVINNYITIATLISKFSKNLNIQTENGSTPLHYACSFKFKDVAKILLSMGADINIPDNELMYPIILSIIQNDYNITEMLIDHKANINLQDRRGNSGLHYAAINNDPRTLFLIFSKYDISKKSYSSQTENISATNTNVTTIYPNITNVDGFTVCHIMLYNYVSENNNYIENLILKTNVNIQDNKGNTILHLIAQRNLWNTFSVQLKFKKLGLYIKNNNGNTVMSLVPIDTINTVIEIASAGYLKYLQKHKNSWLLPWQNECSGLNNNQTVEKCIKYISDSIRFDNSPIPLLKTKHKIVIQHYSTIDYSTFVGENIEVITGMMYLKQKYSNISFIINPASQINNDLLNYNQNLGITMNKSKMIASIEISWVYQRLFFPYQFEEFIKTSIQSGNKIIVVPLEIILSNGGHSNIILININDMVIERFDPHGSGYPFQFNYNPALLDYLLEKNLKYFIEGTTQKKIIYKSPSSYLPHVGFQSLDQIEISINKNIGDPSGFCVLWCIWYMDYRLKYLNISAEKLVAKLISSIKQNNLSFRSMIRNYSKIITDIRDSYLQIINKNINDIINGRLTTNDIDTLYNEFIKQI